MSRTQRIAEVEAELAAQRAEVTEALARLRGLDAELEALRAGVVVADEPEAMPRTEAILAVLRQADGSLSPTGIVERLHAAGRDDSARAVTATLDHLRKQGRVEKVGRGRYVAG